MGQCVSKKAAEQVPEAGPALGESEQPPATEDPAESAFEELRKSLDAKLREDARVSDDVKKGIALVQSVNPTVLEYVGVALNKVGAAHWTLTALKFVGIAMQMWTVATKNQAHNFDLYSNLKKFHATLQSSAVRKFNEQIVRDATFVALKGYALGFVIELDQAWTTLAREGIFEILDYLDNQRENNQAILVGGKRWRWRSTK
ncbi:g8591 [Coccomyxa elongata]